MLKPLKYKNQKIEGFWIDQNGKIYDSNGVEQEQTLRSSSPYYFFKSHAVHVMMAHSFFAYKPDYDVHHLNQVKTDNRLDNLHYMPCSEHRSLHSTGNKNCLGKKHSSETKKKMRAAHQGKIFSDEHKANLSAALRGKIFSEEHKQKIRATRKKKQVYCLQLDRVFESIRTAASELSLFPISICKCCQGKQKTCGGFHFEYFD